MYKKYIISIILILFLITIGCDKEDTPSENPDTPNKPDIPDHSDETVKSIHLFTRLPRADLMIDFVNEHYDYVMTGVLKEEVRQKVKGPKLLLYRSIQGTWDRPNYLDWDYIDSQENMFSHYQGERIKTVWNSW